MKNVLVIGGTRFLGHFITQRLLKEGCAVTLFNRGQTADDFGDRVTRVHGDRNDQAAFIRQFRGKEYDAVIDMIAFRAPDSRSAVEAFCGNTGHFIHISTGAVYLVTQDYPSPLKEEDFDRPLYGKPQAKSEWWDYGIHKRHCEEVLQKAHREKNFPVTIFRLPIVAGERDYTLRAYSYFLRLLDGKPILMPDGGLNAFTLVYQGDIVQTLVANLNNPSAIGEAFNLAQEEILSTKSFITRSARILDKKPELVDIPSTVLLKTPLKTAFSPYFSRRPFVMDIQKAKKDLNFSPEPFDSWLRKTIRWFAGIYTGPPPDNYRLRDEEITLAQKYLNVLNGLF